MFASFAWCLFAVCAHCALPSKNTFSHCVKSLRKCYQQCNINTACDNLPSFANESLNESIRVYRTAQNGDKFTAYDTEWHAVRNDSSIAFNIEIDTQQRYQTMLGFGGAITDATIVNLNSLSSQTAVDDILNAYYNKQIGSGYSMSRVPIASCDFSEYSYTYAPVANDFELKHFNLTQQDFGNATHFGRIAIIQRIQRIVMDNNDRLFLFATPWTPPPWLKNNQAYSQGSMVDNATYWECYASYFVKYLTAYREYGNISIAAVTPQNEPHAPSSWESCQWTATSLAHFIASYLGPKLRTFDADVQLWIFDGQKGFLPEQTTAYLMMSDAVMQYVDGVAFHWYVTPPATPGCVVCNGAFDALNATYHRFEERSRSDSEIIFIATEACTGFNDIESPPKRGPDLGNFNRAQQYAEDIIGDVNNGASSWNDWNLVLDMRGGPNHQQNYVDAPILVDVENGVYYKQPMYYYLAHFAKYIRPHSQRVQVVLTDEDGGSENNVGRYLKFTAVIDTTQMNKTVLVLLNTNETDVFQIQLHDKRFGYTVLSLPPKSIQTVLYENQ